MSPSCALHRHSPLISEHLHIFHKRFSYCGTVFYPEYRLFSETHYSLTHIRIRFTKLGTIHGRPSLTCFFVFLIGGKCLIRRSCTADLLLKQPYDVFLYLRSRSIGSTSTSSVLHLFISILNYRPRL